MSITNGYCTLADLKTILRIADNVDDTMLEARITEASRVIDQHCDRRFYADTAATA
ncbi:MAG: phage head-tail connector protein, partial [Ilumatobacteraceae bacterium]